MPSGSSRPALIAALVVGLHAASLFAASPSYQVYLRSGGVVASARQPLSLFGKVGVYDEAGRLTWIRASSVDLARSRESWGKTEGLADLDSDPLQGKSFEPLEFRDTRGVRRTIPDPQTKFDFVEVWSAY